MSRAIRNKNVHLVSLGCPKNRIDTEAVMGALGRQGYRYAGRLEDAGTVIINTCGFLREAVEEGLSEIGDLARAKQTCGFRLVVTGCLVQRLGRDLKRLVPAIDALVGVHGYQGIIPAVEGRSHLVLPAAEGRYAPSFYHGRVLTTGPGWAYLRIADGCDNRCSYCLIPSIRGRLRSRPLPEIVREARMLAGRGVREINLIAQDTTAYGTDLDGRRQLPELLRALGRVDGIEWIRLMYTHPAHIDERLIEALAVQGKVVRYLDVPLQHVSDGILKSMGRRIDGWGITGLIDKLRAAMPDIVLRTTLMVGYPGERPGDFARLCDFVKQAGFDRLGAFAYSPEPGTEAARLPVQVGQRTKQGRLKTLMELQKRVSLGRNRKRIGQKTRVLIEGRLAKGDPMVPFRAGYQYFGRSSGEAPEIDGKVYIRSRRELAPGEFQAVTIDQAWSHDLGAVTTSKG